MYDVMILDQFHVLFVSVNCMKASFRSKLNRRNMLCREDCQERKLVICNADAVVVYCTVYLTLCSKFCLVLIFMARSL